MCQTRYYCSRSGVFKEFYNNPKMFFGLKKNVCFFWISFEWLIDADGFIGKGLRGSAILGTLCLGYLEIWVALFS